MDRSRLDLYAKHEAEIESPIELLVFALRKAILLIRQAIRERERLDMDAFFTTTFRVRKLCAILQDIIVVQEDTPHEAGGRYLLRYFESLQPALEFLEKSLDPQIAQRLIDSLQKMLEAVQSLFTEESDGDICVTFPPPFQLTVPGSGKKV